MASNIRPMKLDLSSLSTTGRFFAGVRFLFAGILLVLRHPSLWGYLLAPITILATLFAIAVPLSWTSIGWLMGEVFTPRADSFLLAWMWATVGLLVRVAFLALLGLALYFTAGIVATPFNDRLSDQVEQMMLGRYEEPFSWRVLLGDLANSMSHTILSLILWLTVVTFSLLLNVLPVVGSVLSFLVATSSTAVFLGRESMDGCLSRRRMSYRHKYRVVSRHFPLIFGFGLAASALLWIPFLNFLMLPMAVVGGTILYCELERQGLVPDQTGAPGYRPIRHLPPQALPEMPKTPDEAPDEATTVAATLSRGL